MAKAKMALTEKQYYSLPYEGQELHDYWMEWNPSLYNQAVKDGDLYQLLESKGQQMQDEIDSLMQQGLQVNEAREIVWEEIYSSYQG